ncbi:T9SS type A sorting domain-containing protein [Bacteroidota bacterium]
MKLEKKYRFLSLLIFLIATNAINLFPQNNSDKNNSFHPPENKYHSIFKETMIIPDFQVNENRWGDDEQLNCDVASDADGNFVIVWEDYRDTVGQSQQQTSIYAQRYNSTGESIGDNYLISSGGYGEYSISPSISMRPDGYFVIIWKTGSNIIAQLFNPDGTRKGEQIIITDPLDIVDLKVSMNSDGEFVVLWISQLYNPPWQTTQNLFLNVFSFQGIAITDKIRVNEVLDNCSYREPSISHSNNGNFAVAWDASFPPNPFVQIFLSNGNRIGNNILIDNEFGVTPSISMFTNNEFIVGWSNNNSIYAQLFNADGTPKTPKFLVNDDTPSEFKTLPTVTTMNSGNFAITWQDERNGNPDIYAQTFDSNGNPLGSNLLINDDLTSKVKQNPSIATDGVDRFIIAWQDARGTWAKRDIFYQKLLENGVKSGINHRVTEQVVFDYQETPDIDTDSIGSCVIVWEGPGPAGVGIYGQIYTNEGVTINHNFKIIDGTSTPIPSVRLPSVAMDPKGYFTVVWEDVRNDNQGDILAQRYTNDGLPVGTFFKVGNFALGSREGFPQIATDGIGNFIIVWHYAPEDLDYDIYAQLFTEEGIPEGDAFRINDLTFSYQAVPSVAMNKGGEFVVAWQESPWTSGRNIYLRKFNFNGIPAGADIKVNDETGDYGQIRPKVAMSDDGSFAVVWYTWGTYKDIYIQFYSPDLSPIGGNIKVNDDDGNSTQAFPDITIDEVGNYFVVWEDYRNGGTSNIFGQLFNRNGSRLGNNFKVTTIDFKTQIRPKVVSSSSSFYTTWISNVYGNAGSGNDIWSNLFDYDYILENNGQINADRYSLEQNYPNPFNPITTIKFTISDLRFTTLKVYDLLGREVATLVNEQKPAGSYEIEFNGSGFSSGIYFYQLSAGDYIETRKMVLLK